MVTIIEMKFSDKYRLPVDYNSLFTFHLEIYYLIEWISRAQQRVDTGI